MSITIDELLQSKEMQDLQILAGHAGCKNRIEITNITDSDEIAKWLSGNELILSNGMIFQGRLEIMAPMIRALCNAGAAGILIKLHRYINRIPEDAIRAANECGFPLLVAPEAFHFSSINRILSQKANKLPLFAQRYTAFTELLSQNVGINAYLRLLSSYIKKDVVYYDNLSAKRFINNPQCVVPEYDDPALGEFCHQNYYRTVTSGNTICGTLVIVCSSEEIFTDEVSLATVDYTVNVLRISQQKTLPARFQDSNWKDRFVAELLRGNSIVSDDEIKRRGRLSAYDFFQSTTVAVIEPADHRRGTVQLIEEILSKEHVAPPNVLQLPIENHYVLLWGGNNPEEKLTAYCNELLKLLKKNSILASSGIGTTVDAPKLLCDSYRTAKRAVQVGSCFGSGDVHHCNKMQAWNFLYTYANTTEAVEVIQGILGPLQKYDRGKPQYALLPTLKVLAQCGFNLTGAADLLFVHYNTLKYRYNKICEILNMDLSEFHNQVQIHLAMSLLELQRDW